MTLRLRRSQMTGGESREKCRSIFRCQDSDLLLILFFNCRRYISIIIYMLLNGGVQEGEKREIQDCDVVVGILFLFGGSD